MIKLLWSERFAQFCRQQYQHKLRYEINQTLNPPFLTPFATCRHMIIPIMYIFTSLSHIEGLRTIYNYQMEIFLDIYTFKLILL